MTLGIVAYLAVVGAGIALAAWVLEGGLRLADLPGRWAWVGAIGLLCGSILFAPRDGTVAQAGSPAVAHAVAVSGEHASPGTAGLLGVLGTVRSTLASAPQRLTAAIDGRLPRWGIVAVTVLWVAASGLLLLILAFVHLRYRRRLTGWPTVRLHDREIHVSTDVGPAIIGLWRPAIVIPRSLLDVGAADLRVVLAHEEEHLSARDNWLLATGCVAAALIPWHPASWWMLTRLRLAVELDCDRRVLRRGIERRLYGETLIDLGARGRRLPLGVAALADHSTHLERRLLAMTSASRSFARSRAATLVALSALIVAAACEARLPTSPEIERMDVSAVEANPVVERALSSDPAPIYLVDGKPVPADAARAIAPERIASVEVVKGGSTGTAPIIRIVTREDPSATAPSERDDPTADAELRLGPTRIGLQRLESSAVLGIERIDRFDGLVLIDGVRASTAALSRIDPAHIASIEVLKGSAASALYREPEAANGVIHIRMKQRSAVP